MPKIMQIKAAGKGPDIRRYLVSLFDEPRSNANTSAFDGVAMLTVGQQPRIPTEAFGTHPTDEFQKIVEPYWPWHTREQAYIRPPEEPAPHTEQVPRIQSKSIRVYRFLKATEFACPEDFMQYYQEQRAPDVMEKLQTCGATSYIASISDNSTKNPFNAVEEYCFEELQHWEAFLAKYGDSSVPRLSNIETAVSRTQFVGI